MNLKKLIIIALIIVSSNNFAQNIKIKPLNKYTTGVEEPSDICINPDNPSQFFMVSDNGYLYETNNEGKILKTANFRGIDTEAVFCKDNKVYVIEEFSRKINVFDANTLTLEKSKTINYNGGRNKAFESFTFNKDKNVFILITEKDPIYIFELDENFNIVNEIIWKEKIGDISAATYYNNSLWFLSDEDRTVIKVNPKTYAIEKQWIVPIINPEGICFDKEGNLIIASDDHKKIYLFNNPEK